MIHRLAFRSLTAHPVRSAILALGFGAGVAVMAILLGVADVVLRQAQSPALVGGGDVVVRLGRQVPAAAVLSGALRAEALAGRVAHAAPFATGRLFLVRRDGSSVRVDARGGLPSAERALGDGETSDAIEAGTWRDTPEDAAWLQTLPEAALRQIDRFHPIPDAPEWADSWAEWLYFNGRGADARFYLTFLVGPRLDDGRRAAGVRLQLERSGRTESYSTSTTIDEAAVQRAPDLTIGASSVRLDGLRYHVTLDLVGPRGRRLTGTLALDASPSRLVPPIEIAGAKGWMTGYVVPVLTGPLAGTLHVDGDSLSLDGRGYHDHNWGFWRGVSWQWGQAQHDDVSVLYGRVFPPPDAVDAERMPGFVGLLGPEGPLGYATNVRIAETDGPDGRPARVDVTARGPSMDVRVRFDVTSAVTTRMAQGPRANGLDFLQMQGRYTVQGRAAGRTLDYTAAGAAETFRGEAARSRRGDDPKP